MKKAVFIDKDGTLIVDVPYNVNPDYIALMPEAGNSLRQLKDAGYGLFVVSNQSGVARGLFRESALKAVEERINQLLKLSAPALMVSTSAPICRKVTLRNMRLTANAANRGQAC
jgi:HAD superfamily hydrolase (TIGR01662 family)